MPQLSISWHTGLQAHRHNIITPDQLGMRTTHFLTRRHTHLDPRIFTQLPITNPNPAREIRILTSPNPHHIVHLIQQ